MNDDKSARLHYVRVAAVFVGMFCAIQVLSLFGGQRTYAAEPTVTCQNLSAQQSDDKNYYTIVATASAAKDSDIAGYRFDFGDRQSYTFNFDTTSNKDRYQATVRHTYEKAGNYTVVANVISSVGSQAGQTASPNCMLKITIADTSGLVLPATGPDTFRSLVITVASGVVTYCVAFVMQDRHARNSTSK
jgi:hypothetical protein